MSNQGERFKGAAEELGGNIEKGAGKILGNDRMEAEGEAKKLGGQARQEAAKAAERLKGTGEEIEGAVKSAAGHVVGNERWEAEGKAKKLEGEARKKANK